MAKSINVAFPNTHILGYSNGKTQDSRDAIRSGIFFEVHINSFESISKCDLIIIASPLSSYEIIARVIQEYLAKDALVIDVGSVKSCTEGLLFRYFPANFIPCHPIAGRETSGFASSVGDLFKEKLVILTPFCGSSEHFIGLAMKFWELVGARCQILDADLHDRIYAYVSHFPQVLMFAYKNVLDKYGIPIPETAFFRLTKSNMGTWRDIIEYNKQNICDAYEDFKSLAILAKTMQSPLDMQENIANIMKNITKMYQQYAGSGLASITNGRFFSSDMQKNVVLDELLSSIEDVVK